MGRHARRDGLLGDYVYGRTADSGEMYLTHATWTPGDPTWFTWLLPEHYVAFRFALRVAIGDDVVCVEETSLEFEVPPDDGEPVCETFSIGMDITDPEGREVMWTWPAYPGAEAYVLEWYEILDDDSEALRGSILLGPGTTAFTVRLPEPTAARDTWRVRVRVQLDGGFPCFAERTFGFLHHLPDCEDFTLVETVHTAVSSTIIWSEYPGAMGYMMSVLDETGETMIPPFPLLLPPDQFSYVLEGLPPGNYLVRVGPWMEATFCEEELTLTFEQGQFPCLIRTNRTDVRVRVGPGVDRAAFAFLTAGVEYPVIGFAYDAAGNRWWQLDRAAIPGGEAALSLWVLDSEVEEIGDCDNVPQGEVPPDIPAEPWEPEEPQEPGEPGEPGQWLPCGSCNTCGHPASECVTSPEGLCLWDPATCAPAPQCYSLSVSTAGCPHGTVAVLTPPNCDGGWSPGSTVTLSADISGQCKLFEGWSGTCPGASGTSTSITITMNASCSVIATFY
ncbi:MAG: hypothetical protein M5U29_16725 [Anaerolineae bacterium]|nr:hypothetical protein [Anaerolineae bacterium]